ncbi:MAG: hypothetical protein OCD76_02325 [Reichenbachiella sp.]
MMSSILDRKIVGRSRSGSGGLFIFFLISTLFFTKDAMAHHYKGLPHYNYFDNYPQVPILEYIEETPEYEVFITIYNFQGLDLDMVEAPNDVRFYIYLYNIEKANSYLGPANFDVYSHGKLIHKFIGIEQEEESIYNLRSNIKEQDDLILKITFMDEDGKEVIIDVPIEITESFWDKYWLYLAIASFFAVVAIIKKSSGNIENNESDFSSGV